MISEYQKLIAMMAAIYDAGLIAKGGPGREYGDPAMAEYRATAMAAQLCITEDEDEPQPRGVPVEVVERLVDASDGVSKEFPTEEECAACRDALSAARAAIEEAKR